MKKRRIFAAILSALLAVSVLAGCGAQGTTSESGRATTSAQAGEVKSDHEPITIQSPYRNLSEFTKILHEKYPEINLEIQPYSGANTSAYVSAQLEAGDMPDIYVTTIYSPGQEDLSDRLIDLSGYEFTGNYSESLLRDVEDNGAIYLLPTFYTCLGITYNKTLLEKHGWTLPNSLKELRELAPKVKAAGCNLAINQIALPGYGFQYLCNILDTDFLNTVDGRNWQNAYLKGETNVAKSKEMQESLKLLDTWKELGLLNANGDPSDDVKTKEEMMEGNTLFMLGSLNAMDMEKTDLEFKMMPYLSEDGTRNTFILNTSRYMGLNKHLEDKGNEQKLEDALHVLEVLSTKEGMSALNKDYKDSALLPLKDYEPSETNYYYDVKDELNAGYTAPFIYSGWDNLIVPIGETMLSYIKGEATLKDVANAFDENQKLLEDNSSAVYTTVTEKLDTDTCAKLVGICFAKAAKADVALVSKNKWFDIEGVDYNLNGVSGALFALPVTDQEITTILPTGWRGNIQTVTLTGKRIQELAETGYDLYEDGEHLFPYELVMPEGFTLEDDKTYTVAICGATEEVAEEGNLTDTGILGLDAAKAYFKQFETLSKSDIVW